MVILTNPDGNELEFMNFSKFDVDLNEEKDFELRMQNGSNKSGIETKGRLFVPDTEFGGIIGTVKSETAENEIVLSGRTWRGILEKKIIKPPAGEAYKTVTGELNDVLEDLIAEHELTALFRVSETDTGVSVSDYQFDRYITLLSGIDKMLESVGYRLKLKYTQQERGLPGFVQIEAVKISDMSKTIELSQDSRLDFTLTTKKDGVNHLVCLGKGELTERVVADLYVQKDGSIGKTRYFSGIDEITDVYENVSADTEEDLTEKGKEKLLELSNNQTFEMGITSMGIDVDIGDIIGGRDYVSGMSLAKPVVNKIYTEENGTVKIEYKLKGDDSK